MIKIIPKKHCTVVSDQSHPQKKQCKTVKWLSEEALQIAEKRRETKYHEVSKASFPKYLIITNRKIVTLQWSILVDTT